jgi:hypothetical protein
MAMKAKGGSLAFRILKEPPFRAQEENDRRIDS